MVNGRQQRVEAFMRNRLMLASVGLVLSLSFFSALYTPAIAKAPEGYRDVKLGMTKNQVLDVLQKAPGHFSFDDLGLEVGEIIRSDDLFRHATYRFNPEGTLVEIDLEMREILGRERVLELFGDQLGIKLSPTAATQSADLIIEVRNNSVSLRKDSDGTSRSAKSAR